MISVGRHAFEIFGTSCTLPDGLASMDSSVVFHVASCVKSHVATIKCTENVFLVIVFLHMNNQCSFGDQNYWFFHKKETNLE